MLLFSRIVLLTILLSFYGFYLQIPSVAGISSREAVNEVTVDGKWTSTDEWSDALEIKDRRALGYVRVKDDSNKLYLLIDFTSDTSMDTRDMVRIRLDTDNDKAKRPQSDDYMILVTRIGDDILTRTVQGDGASWVLAKTSLDFQFSSSLDPENDPYSDTPHLIYEAAIPRKVFKNRPEIGISLTVGDKMGTSEAQFINLPRRHHYMSPATWGTLKFATISAQGATEVTTSTATATTQTSTLTSATAIRRRGLPAAAILIIVIAAAAALLGAYYYGKKRVS